MRFRALGPLRVWDGVAWLPVPAAQQRLLLAVLLVEAGRVVTTDRLVEELWGMAPPKRAPAAVQVYVGRLRRLMGGAADRLVTDGRGYRVVVGDGDLDAHQFERLVAAGQADRGQGRLVAAVDRLAEGLGLWRGPAMVDVPVSPTVAAEVARLEGRRLTALEDRLAALLDLGRHGDVVDELAKLVAENPLRERFQVQYMLALYRCGRRADALDAYRRAHRALVAELGLEPGPELRQLEQAVLGDALELTGPTQLGFPAVRRVPPAQLPADVAGFTGRDGYLRRLDAVAARTGTVVIERR